MDSRSGGLERIRRRRILVRPFAPAGHADSGTQIDFDARRVDYLERVAVNALLGRSEALNQWIESERRNHSVQKPGSDPPQMVSRFEAGYATLCDAIRDVGVDRLDPGLAAVRQALHALPPLARTRLLTERLAADDRTAAIARATLAHAYPERVDELFGWGTPGIDVASYWAPKLESVHMEYLLDTADFGANELLRILYLFAETPEHLRSTALLWRDHDSLDCDPNFPTDGGSRLRRLFTSFKYWFDDPFRCDEFTGRAKEIREQANDAAKLINHFEKMDAGADMTYWSENHRLLFATAEYLAGQYWPDDMFVSAREHRRDGSERTGDVHGAQHRDKGRARALRWLDERLRMGFAEWNAPGYYVEDLMPLVNLADFAGDEEIRVKAAMVLDLLLFDLAVNQMGGAFAGSAGRAYFEHKNCSWGQSVRDCSELIFGRSGHYVGVSNAAVFLATSPAYQPPDALILLGRRPPATFTSRARVSINFDEAHEHGVGYSSPDDMEFWWSRAAYATKQTVLGSHKVAADYGLLHTPPFSEIIPKIKAAAAILDTAEDVGAGILGGIAGAAVGFALGGPVGAVAGAAGGAALGASIPDFTEADAADLASVLTEGSVLSRANLYTYHCGGALLASVQNYRPGQINFQSLPCVATLANGAMVWTSYPSAGSRLVLDIGSTTWALLGLIVGGPIGLAVGAFVIPDLEIDEKIFKPDLHDGPNWWTGNAVQPRVVQKRGAAITAYEAQEIQRLLFGERTHAWFPKSQFEQCVGPEPARCNLDSARWFFGAVGDSYVGLFSARETDWADGGPWQDKEIRAEGPTNIFITQVGDAAEFGSFTAFIAAVTQARVHVSGLNHGSLACSYDIPNGDRLELHYGQPSRYAGMVLVEDEFPRYINPFARIAWQQDRYVIHHDGQSVVHDVVNGTRTLGGRLTSLSHDTPLTFYEQNMGLLQWPLYKGVDRDGALDHLISVLRVRQPDVVGLSEMWTDDDRSRVTEELADVYPYTLEGPHDPLIETPLGDIELTGGGLLLLSRHRIVATDSTVYRQCSGDDCLANKGVLHARIHPRGHPTEIDVFLTHTQAAHPTVGGTTAGARRAVEAQIRHLSAFIRASRDPLAPAVLFGDFNVDAVKHPDLYEFLVATLGNPLDTAPSIAVAGRMSTATSESDDGNISSFQPDHPLREPDAPERFGSTAERLDYIFAFPGLLYQQQVASARVVVEQWARGRDMSDHYGVEAFIDTTVQLLPTERDLSAVTVRAVGFRCLQTTSGPGDDEVAFTMAVLPDRGRSQSVSTGEFEDIGAGDSRTLTLELDLGDPGELTVAVDGREIDSLSADDSLGRVLRRFEREELYALADAGPTLIGMPVLRGDDGEYVVDIQIDAR